MKKPGLFVAVVLILAGCGEKTEPVDVNPINAVLAKDSTIKSAEDFVKQYYQVEFATGTVEITSEELETGRYEVTLIESKMHDDSMEAMKLVMTIRRSGSAWEVESAVRNWRCYEGRGHTDWGIELCH